VNIDLPSNHYDFNAADLQELMGEAQAQVAAQLVTLGYAKPTQSVAASPKSDPS
jgi:hypothetical protein